jgi:hypothetical protein
MPQTVAEIRRIRRSGSSPVAELLLQPLRWRMKVILRVGDMPLDGTAPTPLMLPRIGAAIGGAALLCPALTLPLVIACVVALGRAALDEARADNRVPELSPARAPKRAARRSPKLSRTRPRTASRPATRHPGHQ